MSADEPESQAERDAFTERMHARRDADFTSPDFTAAAIQEALEAHLSVETAVRVTLVLAQQVARVITLCRKAEAQGYDWVLVDAVLAITGRGAE